MKIIFKSVIKLLTAITMSVVIFLNTGIIIRATDDNQDRIFTSNYFEPKANDISINSKNKQEEINNLLLDFSEKLKKECVDTLNDEFDYSLLSKYYAGAYYDFKKNKLYICLTQNDSDSFKKYLKSDSIEYKTVKYNYDYLSSIIEEINKEEYFKKFEINYSYIDINDNCVVIALNNLDKINEVDNYLVSKKIDKKAVKYKYIQRTENVPTSYNEAGRKIYAQNINTNPGTIGCNATRTYNGTVYKGILTCAHVINNYPTSTWQTVTDNGTRMDLLNPNSPATKKVDNSLVDIAFVPFSNQSTNNTPYIWNKYNSTINQGKIVSFCSNITIYQGQIVTKYGVSGELSGTITMLNYSGSIGGKNRTDFFRISAQSYFGDSGGPVGVYYMNNGNKLFTLYGFTTAMERPAGSTAQSGPALCCKWSNVSSQLSVTPISGPGYPY